MSVHQVDFRGDLAKRVRRILGRSIRTVLEHFDGKIAGFAIVVWDTRGDATTAYLTSQGPVARALMPLFAKDALDRHVTLAIAEDTDSARVTGEE